MGLHLFKEANVKLIINFSQFLSLVLGKTTIFFNLLNAGLPNNLIIFSSDIAGEWPVLL
jgi:hypothetical protein